MKSGMGGLFSKAQNLRSSFSGVPTQPSAAILEVVPPEAPQSAIGGLFSKAQNMTNSFVGASSPSAVPKSEVALPEASHDLRVEVLLASELGLAAYSGS